MKTKYILCSVIFLAGFSSCKKWLDVKPKTEIESSYNFETEQGFKDALTGVYVNMTNPDLYGKELTYGFVDVLAKNYTQFNNYNDYYQDALYNYAFPATQSRINKIWNGNYNTIANINNLIDNIDKANKNLFSGSNYNVIKGEAYGLRAFNYFDLLRLFAPSVASNGTGALAIPYRTTFGYNKVKQSTVGEVIQNIIADLQVASDLLKVADPLVKGSSIVASSGSYLRDRTYKFNYYAVKALMARVYLYSGDTVNALICAKEVIESNNFPFTEGYEIAGGNNIMSTEVIFNLNINTLQVSYDNSFSNSNPAGMYLSYGEWDTVFEINSIGSSDYRYIYQTVDNGDFRVTTKFNPANNQNNGAAANRLPLMRLSEMYYIAAECLKSTDRTSAITYLNTIRTSRNLPELTDDLASEEIQDEIFKEYRKDFFCEGQLFYYYKRLNLKSIEFSQIVADNKVYVLPIPDTEKEYGSIN